MIFSKERERGMVLFMVWPKNQYIYMYMDIYFNAMRNVTELLQMILGVMASSDWRHCFLVCDKSPSFNLDTISHAGRPSVHRAAYARTWLPYDFLGTEFLLFVCSFLSRSHIWPELWQMTVTNDRWSQVIDSDTARCVLCGCHMRWPW